VKDRVYFQKGDAANLDFADASFDAEISNFVFHEVRSQPDKLALIREALRVLKPDGVFVFEDIFFAKSHYGEMKDFVKQLKSYASEIHFVDTRHPDFEPEFLNTPLVLGQMGLIYGRK
jgi:ubiquinone/menaquinone biosynthesis C-methylase UbiE